MMFCEYWRNPNRPASLNLIKIKDIINSVTVCESASHDVSWHKFGLHVSNFCEHFECGPELQFVYLTEIARSGEIFRDYRVLRTIVCTYSRYTHLFWAYYCTHGCVRIFVGDLYLKPKTHSRTRPGPCNLDPRANRNAHAPLRTHSHTHTHIIRMQDTQGRLLARSITFADLYVTFKSDRAIDSFFEMCKQQNCFFFNHQMSIDFLFFLIFAYDNMQNTCVQEPKLLATLRVLYNKISDIARESQAAF